MVQIPLFKVEQWMDAWETKCLYNLAETCCDSITLSQLQDYSGSSSSSSVIQDSLLGKRMTYGHIRGSPELRSNIASLYTGAAGLDEDNVLITQGAIGANFLSLLTLVGPGDHVVCVHPTYQQLWDVPCGLGANVDLWRLDPSTSWAHSLDQLITLLRPTTKLLIINNPNNPTGQAISRDTLGGIIDAVKKHAAPECIIMSDEVYRPLFHSVEAPPSILEMGYEHVIATGSLSKAWSLAGLRVGWIATPRKDLIEDFAAKRDYIVISVSMVDNALAALALSPQARAKIHERNMQLARTNRAILAEWLQSRKQIRWTPTQGGTTALLHLGDDVDDEQFCEDLCVKKGVLLAPGTCFDFPGWVRIGYVGNTQELQEGLSHLGAFLDESPLPRSD